MKILIIMDPGIRIPVKGYGGHERLVELFAKEYHRLGHEVHLLITSGSEVKGCTVHDFGKEGFPPKKVDARKAILVAWKFLWKHRDDFDLIHNFGRLVYLVPVLRQPVKKIMTYGREIHNRNIRLINKLNNRNLFFTACSRDLLSRIDGDGIWKVVYNAISFAKYDVVEKVPDDGPLIFLGRIEQVKGCHTAIELAKRSGQRLIIAGNISSLPEEITYFDQEIKPHIDNQQVMYVGALNDEQKNYYLGISKALIFPIEWNEPFGLVMIEAMACGTPVIAFNRGSVNEVVEEGITGYKVNSLDEMVDAVRRVHLINRQNCADQAKKKFDAPVVAQQYLGMGLHPKKNIVIVTTGQPAANPRVMKEYQTLVDEGNHVRILYTYSAEWSYKIDEEKFNKGILKRRHFILVGGNPFTERFKYFFSRVNYKIIKKIEPAIKIGFLKKMALVRSGFHLWMNAKRYKADIYIAHYLGALPAVISAAAKYNAAAIFDAEDFHRGEEPYYANQIDQVIAIENELLPKVDLITTASPMITEGYRKLYPGKKVITINNVFSRKYLQHPEYDKSDLKIFWFSQNIGPNRGLEIVIDAINLLEFHVSFSIMGNKRDELYIDSLLKRSNKADSINFINPLSPETVFKVAADFDIGIAAEIPYCENRNMCLTNKIFTYLLAGNCILASDTDAQKEFMESHQNIGLLYRNNDSQDLAAKIRYLKYNRDFLNDCRQNALKLADCCLNWETESKKLESAIDEISAGEY